MSTFNGEQVTYRDICQVRGKDGLFRTRHQQRCADCPWRSRPTMNPDTAYAAGERHTDDTLLGFGPTIMAH